MEQYEDFFMENLIGQILRQAADDYVNAIKHNDERKIRNLEKWFRSGYGQLMSSKQGDEIINRCRKIAKENGAIRCPMNKESQGPKNPKNPIRKCRYYEDVEPYLDEIAVMRSNGASKKRIIEFLDITWNSFYWYVKTYPEFAEVVGYKKRGI